MSAIPSAQRAIRDLRPAVLGVEPVGEAPTVAAPAARRATAPAFCA